MDPQMSSVLAGRVALERFDSGHRPDRPGRRSSSLVRLSRSIAAAVTRRIASRRSRTRAAGHVPAASPSTR